MFSKNFLLLIISLWCSLNYCSAIGVSSKLDFGDDDDDGSDKSQQSSKLYESLQPKSYVSTQANVNINKNGDDEFDTIGVVCTSSGCNTTKNNNKSNKQDVETDIIVHVKTNVNNFDKQNQTEKILKETPDVPTIIGTTDYDNNVPSPNKNLDKGYLPSLSSTYDINKDTHKDPQFVFGTEGLDPNRNYWKEYLPSNRDKLLSPSSASSSSGNDNKEPLNNYRYKVNDLELRNVYFIPSLYRQNFGDSLPTTYYWYPIIPTGQLYNAMQIKNLPKSSSSSSSSSPLSSIGGWSTTSYWPAKIQNPFNQQHQVDDCPCRNQNKGLQWYPLKKIVQQSPGEQINDKLAPLN